jgi:DNA adenine methylase
LSKTDSYTAYTDTSFEEKHQIELAHFFDECAKKDAYIILSNSDPKNEDPTDDFFELHYGHYIIERILAKRSINCIGEKRGEIYELLIRNYKDT